MRLLRRLSDRDANEEVRYIATHGRYTVCWSWLWLSWYLGPYAALDPYAGTPFVGEGWSQERWVAGLGLGPLGIELRREAA